jgi:PAS domain S-box-containing protein
MAERNEPELLATNERLREQAAALEAQAKQAEHALASAERAQRIAEDAEARYRRLFETSPLPQWTVDFETLRILDVNEAAVQRYGYSREDFRELTLRDLRDAGSLDSLALNLSDLARDGRLTTLVRHRTKHGERFDVELSARAIVHDGRAAFVSIMTDVTARLRAEVRQQFLVDASDLLAESLDYGATLARIVKLAVPLLADWAAYNTVDGEYVRVAAIHHSDPAMERLAREVEAKYPTRADVGAGVAKVIATGTSELIPEIPDEVLRTIAHDEIHYAQLRGIGFRSLINVPLVARGRVLGALGFATGESKRVFTPADLAFAEELARRAGLALDNALHFRAEQEARARAEMVTERLARLQHLAATVSNAVDLDTVSRLVVREIRTAVNADAMYIARRLPGGDELELVYSEGLPHDMEGERQRFSLEMRVPGAHVVRTCKPLWLSSPDERDAEFPHLNESPIARAFGSSATLPLLVDRIAVGSLAMYFEAPRAFSADDRAFLTALAEQVALAIERVRLFEAEQRARTRAEALQRVTALLAGAKSVADIGRVFSLELTALLGADTAWVGTVSADATSVDALGWSGFTDEAVARWRRTPLETVAVMTDVIRSGRAQWWNTAEALVAAYPARAEIIRAGAQESVAVLPLIRDGAETEEDSDGGRVIGGIAFGFRTPQQLDADTQAFFTALAQQCAQAIARARAYEAERLARTDADAARLRSDQLQALTSALARAVSAEAVVDAVIVEGGQAVGSMTGGLALLDEDGRMFTLVPGPGMPRDVRENWHRFPNEGRGPAAEAMRTLAPSYSRTRAEFAERSPELAALAERLQLGANVALPLVVAPGSTQQRIFGILAFTFAEPRPFGPEEDAFLRTVADQCAQALERARLFEAEQAARHRAEVLQGVTAALAEAESTPEVARAALVAATQGSGAPAGTIALLSDDRAWFHQLADVGFANHNLAEWQRFPNSGNFPAADVVATGTPQFFVDRAAYVARYPEIQPLLEAHGLEASALLPLTRSGGGKATGYLSLHYWERHAFPADEISFLHALAEVTAQALERARLYEAEKEARADAEAANRSKSEFLATMSHELRTPLNAIGGYAELLALGIHGPVSPEQQSALARIQRSQKHLLSLINEVLNYARLEAAAVHYDLRDVGVDGVLASVESFIMPQVRAKGLQLSISRCDPSLTVRADVEKLGQVLLNLLSNAVKFTEAGGTIAITCRTRADLDASSFDDETPEGSISDVSRVEAFLEIAVTDTGVGIPAEQLDRIFEPFVQIGRTLNSPVEGTGLGLAISRDLARGMGGDLRVRSVLGEGSTFAVILGRAGM